MLKQLISFVLSSLVFLCTKAQDPDYADEDIIKIYSQLGDIHNKGLDAVFENLQKTYGERYSGDNSKESYLKINHQMDEVVKNYVTEELVVKDIEMTKFIESYHLPIMPKSENVDLVTLIKSKEDGKTLSEEFLNSMSELNTIIEKGNLSPNKEDYENLLKKYISQLKSFKEKVYLTSCISIGYSSELYWSKNFSKWKDFFLPKSSTISGTPTSKAKDIVKADISGIIVGGIGGCVSGAIGGTVTFPGVGTIAGCAGVGAVGAVTGGLGGSMVSAVNSFLDWLVG